jgi:hypothetical protein
MLRASGLAVWGMWYGAWFFADAWYCPHRCENGLPWYTVALVGMLWFLVLLVAEWLFRWFFKLWVRELRGSPAAAQKSTQKSTGGFVSDRLPPIL